MQATRKRKRANASNRKEVALNRQEGSTFNIMQDIVLPCVRDLNMREVPRTSADGHATPLREGRFFYAPEDQASGYYWVYANRDFAVSVTSMRFRRDFQQHCLHPRLVSVSYLQAGSYVRQDTGLVVKAPYLEGHATKGCSWNSSHKAGQLLHSVGIMLTPPFYERYLGAIYRGESFSAEDAFASIDGLTDFSEMIVLMKQIEAYRGTGASARLFYRSKVEEAVALVVDKSRSLAARSGVDEARSPFASALSHEDARAIERVRKRLDERLADPVSALELTRIACMGQTKLRRAFKQAYGCTIVEYRQRKRCARAAELLASSGASVAQAAATVGYRPERLAELFARIYGATPSVYRESLGQAGNLASNTIHVDTSRASTRASSVPPIRSTR